MKEEKIKKIVTGNINTLSKLAKSVSDGFEKESIHGFRVAVKSIRSFLRLLAGFTGNPDIKLSKELNRLYHVAGAIRDRQLELEKTQQMAVQIPTYTQYLENIIRHLMADWDKNYSKKIFSKLVRKLESIKIGPVAPGALQHFISEKMISAEGLVKPVNITDSQLHSVRKHIKDIVYVTEIARNNWKSALRKIKKPGKKELKMITGTIGDYNDGRNQMEHIKSFSSKLVTPRERKIVKTLCLDMAKKLRSDKQAIVDKVRHYVSVYGH